MHVCKVLGLFAELPTITTIEDIFIVSKRAPPHPPSAPLGPLPSLGQHPQALAAALSSSLRAGWPVCKFWVQGPPRRGLWWGSSAGQRSQVPGPLVHPLRARQSPLLARAVGSGGQEVGGRGARAPPLPRPRGLGSPSSLGSACSAPHPLLRPSTREEGGVRSGGGAAGRAACW